MPVFVLEPVFELPWEDIVTSESKGSMLKVVRLYRLINVDAVFEVNEVGRNVSRLQIAKLTT